MANHGKNPHGRKEKRECPTCPKGMGTLGYPPMRLYLDPADDNGAPLSFGSWLHAYGTDEMIDALDALVTSPRTMADASREAPPRPMTQDEWRQQNEWRERRRFT